MRKEPSVLAKFEPDPERQAIYRNRAKTYKRLLDEIEVLYKGLNN